MIVDAQSYPVRCTENKWIETWERKRTIRFSSQKRESNVPISFHKLLLKNFFVKRSIFKDRFDPEGVKIPVTKHIRDQQMFQIVLLESLSDFTKPVKQYVTIQWC